MNKEKFLEKVKVMDSGCWEWQGEIIYSGYGATHFRGKHQTAHRVAYLLFRGDIPIGLEPDHICLNKSCVNPEHLRLISHRDNLLASNGVVAKAARQTHCIHGHPFDLFNTIYHKSRKSIQRHCRMCREGKDKTLKVVC